MLHSIDISSLSDIKQQDKRQALTALEQGQILYFPHYAFKLHEDAQQHLLSDSLLKPKQKNISYDQQIKHLTGFKENLSPEIIHCLRKLMADFAQFAFELVTSFLEPYQAALLWGRTSYRPAQIAGRVSSKRKDDTRLHVDAFPSTPVQGLRILRVFCNINPQGLTRVWNIGAPFPQVLQHFSQQLPTYNPYYAKLLQLLKLTKSLRTAYDHYQLNMHDKMKLDDDYQKKVNKYCFEFPAHSSWIVFTDQVSHAALSGQYVLEQTFYLPVSAMIQQEHSPLRQWERALQRQLI